MLHILTRATRRNDDLFNPVSLLALIFCVLIMLSGGASRADALSQVVVRLVSVFTIAALLVRRPTFTDVDRVRPIFYFALLTSILIMIQLVPLPPAIWTHLPGRAHDVDLSNLISVSDAWRPINLTPDLGWNAAMALLPVFATIALLAQVDNKHRWIPIAIVAAVAFCSAILGLAQLTDGPESVLRYYTITSESSAVGVFANRNHNATLLALSIPIIAFCGTRLVNKYVVQKGPALIALAVTLLVLVMIPATGSRFGLVAGFMGLGGSMVWWMKPLKQITSQSTRKTKLLVLAGAFGIIASTIAIAVIGNRAEAIRRLFGTSIVDDQRMTIRPTLFKMVETYFPVGSGFGSFEQVFRRFEPITNLSDSYLNQAHNDFIQIVLEGGLPGLLIASLFAFWWIRAVIRIWRARAVNESVEIARLGTIVTAIILASSVVDYPLRTPLIAIVFTVASWSMSSYPSGQGTGGERTMNRPARAQKVSG